MAEFDRTERSRKSQPIRLAERFAYSDKFKHLFSEGMKLVEESAEFLDGPGRDAIKGLSRSASLIYGTQSMRLTTRLMQLASWLLLQRAAIEGEMTREQVLEEKKKVKLENLPETDSVSVQHGLPERFVELVNSSYKLQARIIRLDNELYGERADNHAAELNPVSDQINLISTAFGAKKIS